MDLAYAAGTPERPVDAPFAARAEDGLVPARGERRYRHAPLAFRIVHVPRRVRFPSPSAPRPYGFHPDGKSSPRRRFGHERPVPGTTPKRSSPGPRPRPMRPSTPPARRAPRPSRTAPLRQGGEAFQLPPRDSAWPGPQERRVQRQPKRRPRPEAQPDASDPRGTSEPLLRADSTRLDEPENSERECRAHQASRSHDAPP